MKARFPVILAIIATVALAVSGLSATTQGPPLAAEQYVKYNDGAEPQYLDPSRSTGIPEANIELACFEGLTRLDAKDNPQAAIAKSWTVSKDNLTYVFKLRPSKWNDGTAVTAADFEYSWKRALSPELAAEYAYQVFYLKNAEAYNSGKAKAEDVGVKALDALTLQVQLRAPCGYFLSLCAFPTYFPVKKAVVEKDPTTWYANPKTYITNGPFKMVFWKHNNYIDLVKNPYYWDATHVKLTKLRFTLVDNQSTYLTMYDTGVVDFIDTPPLQEIDRLRKEGVLKIAPYLGTYYYFFNCTKPPLDNVKVRKALTLAIDRESICKNVTKAGQLPAMGWVCPGLPDAPGSKGDFRAIGGSFFKDNDIAAAKQLLVEAGYPDGKGFPTIEILYNTNEGHKSIAEAVQEMWKKNLGINVTITNQEWAVYLQNRQTGNYQVSRAGWIGDYVDPMTFIDMMMSNAGNNHSFWSGAPNSRQAEYDRLTNLAKTSADPEVRMKAMHDAEKVLMADMPMMPIYYYTLPYLCQDYLKNFTRSALGFADFKLAYVLKH